MAQRYLPFLLIFSMITTCIEVDISIPSFPQIAQYFNINQGVIQLTIAYNFLAFVLGALVYGPVSEVYGRRKTMIAGNLIMTIGAIGCVLANTIDTLLLARFIQGLGASTSIVLVFAIIADCYEGEQAFKLIGLTNAVLSSSMAAAPILGGLINEVVGWRGNYGTVAFMSLASFISLLLFLPETKKKPDKQLDLKQIGTDFSLLLKSLKFMSLSLVPSLLFSAYMVFIAASSFLYMSTFQLPLSAFVLQQAIIVSSFAIISLFSHRIIQKIGQRVSVIFGMSLCTFSLLSLAFIGYIEMNSAFLVTAIMSSFGVGFAICYPTIFGASLEIFPQLRGTASSITMALRALMVFVFTSLSASLYVGKLLSVSLVILLCLIFSLAFMPICLPYFNKKEHLT